MKQTGKLISAMGLWCCSFIAVAHVHLQQGSIRILPPGSPTTSAYVTITNDTHYPLKIVSASSTIADKVEIHGHFQQGDLMQMRQLEAIEIKPGESLALAPGGLHLMLFGLKRALRQGERIPIILTSAGGTQFSFDAIALKPGQTLPAEHHHE